MQYQIKVFWYVSLFCKNITQINKIFNFRPISMKFLKFHFRFSYIASKDAEFNFRGNSQGNFHDPSTFSTPEVDF